MTTLLRSGETMIWRTVPFAGVTEKGSTPPLPASRATTPLRATPLTMVKMPVV